MIQRYTWMQLLNDISKHTQPDAIQYRNETFHWNGHTYVNADEKDLTSYMSRYAADSLCVVSNLSAERDLISEGERIYLKAALAPIRGRIEAITKKATVHGLAYLIIRYKELPEYGEEFSEIESWTFPRGEQFAGMKLGYDYPPEDLGL